MFYNQWCKVTNDKYVLQCIRGARIPFKNGFPPHQTKILREISMTKEQSDFVDKKLIALEANGCIKALAKPFENGWVSNIFVVPKKSGSWHLILNLKDLNPHLIFRKFKMSSIFSVLNMVHPGDFLASIDPTEAYGHMAIYWEHWRYLMSQHKDHWWCYTCVPNGICN